MWDLTLTFLLFLDLFQKASLEPSVYWPPTQIVTEGFQKSVPRRLGAWFESVGYVEWSYPCVCLAAMISNYNRQ